MIHVIFFKVSLSNDYRRHLSESFAHYQKLWIYNTPYNIILPSAGIIFYVRLSVLSNFYLPTKFELSILIDLVHELCYKIVSCFLKMSNISLGYIYSIIFSFYPFFYTQLQKFYFKNLWKDTKDKTLNPVICAKKNMILP